MSDPTDLGAFRARRAAEVAERERRRELVIEVLRQQLETAEWLADRLKALQKARRKHLSVVGGGEGRLEGEDARRGP